MKCHKKSLGIGGMSNDVTRRACCVPVGRAVAAHMHGPIYRIGAWLARSSSPHPFLESSPSCQIVPRLVNHLRGRKCGLTHGEAGLAFMNTFIRDLSSNCDNMNDNAPFVLSQLRMATMTRMTRTFMWMSNQSSWKEQSDSPTRR